MAGIIKGAIKGIPKAVTFLPKTGLSLGGKGVGIFNKITMLIMSLTLGLPDKLVTLGITIPEKLVKYLIIGIENLINVGLFPAKEIGGAVLKG